MGRSKLGNSKRASKMQLDCYGTQIEAAVTVLAGLRPSSSCHQVPDIEKGVVMV